MHVEMLRHQMVLPLVSPAAGGNGLLKKYCMVAEVHRGCWIDWYTLEMWRLQAEMKTNLGQALAVEGSLDAIHWNQ